MKPASRLTLDFAQRMVADLSTNNVLRGAWAEQLVAHYLSISDLPPNWSYYDMRDPAGRDISVKHSVGPLPKFSVAMSQWAWDPSLAGGDPPSDGWRGGSAAPLQYWCHVYVFAWLDSPTAVPPLDEVLDADRWQFAVLSRAEMHRAFVLGKVSGQKSAGLATLRGLTQFVGGSELPALVASVVAGDEEGVPLRQMNPSSEVNLGAPVEPMPTSDVRPDAAGVDDSPDVG